MSQHLFPTRGIVYPWNVGVQQQGESASGQSPHIGSQLRAARLAARKTVAEVAEASGLTKGYLSKVERDLASLSVASLIRLCDTLGISVGSLFSESKGELIRAGEYQPINFGGELIREYLLTPSGEKRVQAILSDIEPGGGSGDEGYSLPSDVEFVFVLAGELVIEVAGERFQLSAGDAFTFPPSAAHSFRTAESSGPVRVLWVISPALPDAMSGRGR